MTQPSTESSRPRSLLPWLALATAAFVAVALWLFPKAMPSIALEQTLTTQTAAERARAFAATHGLPVDGAREAVQFTQDDELQVFLELEAGGKEAVDREVRGRDIALFRWDVRFFRPGDPREVRVSLAPDGRVIGFRRVLAQDDKRPTLDSAAAVTLADSVRRAWLGDTANRWRLVATSVVTVKPSERVDRTVTFERTDRTLGAAPLRLDIVVRGDLPGAARGYAQVPEAFTRRYGERRADNELYANIASAFLPVYLLLGVIAFWGGSRRRGIRWRPAAFGGAVIGGAAFAAALNGIPLQWFSYDTAQPVSTFWAIGWLGALAGGVGLAGISTLLLAMGEYLTRDAFPHHYDWWQTRAQAGTRPVATRVLAGYTMAAFGLAYVSAFYFAARYLGWWSPSSVFDDPNLITTPLPWLSAVAISLQAGVLEEVLFRAIPLALVARASAGRPWQPAAMAGGVVLTALVFGFAHANYASWPAYARGVELFLEAALWAVLYLRVGLVTTIVGHFTYDLVLFGLFTAAGTALPYRLSLAAVAVVVAVPALVVLVQALRRRGLAPEAPDSARFGAWQPPAAPVAAPAPVVVEGPRAVGALTWGAAVLGVVLALLPLSPRATPAFSITRADAEARADSVVRSLGGRPEGWTRLARTSTQEHGDLRRYLRAKGADSLAPRLARPWLEPGTWTVRYVRTDGTVAERTESWEVGLTPDGVPAWWRHVLPESLAAPAVSRDSAEALARAALAALGATPGALSLVSVADSARPARRDLTFIFDDTTTRLPDGASVRRVATVAGDRVGRVDDTVFFPEAWERAESAHSASRAVAIGGTALVLVLGGLVALLLVWRRPAVAAPLAWPPMRTSVMAAAAAGLVWILWGLNDWPAGMAMWDTASPYNRHQWTSALGVLASALVPAALLVFYRVVDAMRQRLGVAVASPSTRDAWVAGAALTLAPALSGLVPTLLLPSTPTVPGTGLANAVPWLTDVLSALSGGLWMTGIAVLLAGAATVVRAPVLRAVVVGLVCVAVGVISGALPSLDGAEWLRRTAVHAVGLALAVAVVWRFGRSSLHAWVVGGVLLSALGQLGAVLGAAHPLDQASHVVGALVALAAIPVLLRVLRPAEGPSPA